MTHDRAPLERFYPDALESPYLFGRLVEFLIEPARLFPAASQQIFRIFATTDHKQKCEGEYGCPPCLVHPSPSAKPCIHVFARVLPAERRRKTLSHSFCRKNPTNAHTCT